MHMCERLQQLLFLRVSVCLILKMAPFLCSKASIDVYQATERRLKFPDISVLGKFHVQFLNYPEFRSDKGKCIGNSALYSARKHHMSQDICPKEGISYMSKRRYFLVQEIFIFSRVKFRPIEHTVNRQAHMLISQVLSM